MNLNNGFTGSPAIMNDVSTNGIDISFYTSGAFANAGFNGEVFKLDNFDLTGIPVTQDMGAIVTFDEHDIYVNFAGLPFSQGSSFIDINITSGSPVPEPGTAWLFASGLAGLIGLKRKYPG